MEELKREKDRVKELEDEKNSILKCFKAEKTIMFRGFEAKMNNILAELDVRGQRIEEFDTERKRWELEKKHFNVTLEARQEKTNSWIKRCGDKNSEVQSLNQRMQETQTRLEEDLAQCWESLEENTLLRKQIQRLESALQSCQVRINELERNLQGTIEQCQKSNDFYEEQNAARSNMVVEAIVQMSKVAKYIEELAVEAKVIEHHINPASKCGKKMSWLISEITELNRRARSYL
ncbi:coiled-coil domain-containing protein 18-like [Hibiscus syriacus]|uniref:coiled-coil domain-containing protein 18-like n=1 Tax=Hibiscus syriacus TaxID=106335 RepID=UPI0019218646|nr:coiled-coil domain-containing protein 18-like [Hibiscus syriacus]